MGRMIVTISVLGFLVLSLGGCAAIQVSEHSKSSKGYRILKIGDIVETRTGRNLSFETLLDELSRVQIVYVGEMHTSIEDHRVQERILKGLHATNPSLVLAMEMFPRETQPVLDRYWQGLISEDAFLKEVAWDKVWGFPFQLYRGLLTWASEKRMRVIGLNAPREVVSKIATSGLSSLSSIERSRIAADFHLNDPKHREYVRSQYGQHLKENIKSFDTFYEAQLAWEETMAETLAQMQLSSAGKDRILVIVGKGHFSDRVGVPNLTLGRVAHTFKTVAPVPYDYPHDVVDPDIADYVWVTEKSEPFHRGRLGIMVRPSASGEGLDVAAVIPNSPAAKAGVLQGDVLHMIDGKVITTLDDVHKAVAGKARAHELMLKRNGRTISVTVPASP